MTYLHGTRGEYQYFITRCQWTIPLAATGGHSVFSGLQLQLKSYVHKVQAISVKSVQIWRGNSVENSGLLYCQLDVKQHLDAASSMTEALSITIQQCLPL